MIENISQKINADADELTYKLSMGSAISECISPYSPLVEQLLSVEERLYDLDPQLHTRNGPEVDALRLIKDELLFRLIEERAEIPESTVKVVIMKYPDEELHALSRNMLIIRANDQDGKPHEFNTFMNLLARARGEQDSRKVLYTIGEPDEVKPSKFHQLLTRTFQESRRANEILNEPEKMHDEELVNAATNIYYSILPSRVKEVCDMDELSIEFDTDDAEFLFTNYRGKVAFSRYYQNDIADVIKMSEIPITKAKTTGK